MASIEISSKAMNNRAAKFKDVVPFKTQHYDSNWIPTAVVEKLNAHNVYPVIVPEAYTDRSSMVPVKAGEHIVVAIAECPPAVSRTFRYISDDLGRLFVVIEAQDATSNDRVACAPSVADEVEEDFGIDNLNRLKDIGFKVDAALED